MSITGANVVMTPGRPQPYMVVLEHDRISDTEHPVGSVGEGEAYIRRRRHPAGGGGFVTHRAAIRRPGLCPAATKNEKE